MRFNRSSDHVVGQVGRTGASPPFTDGGNKVDRENRVTRPRTLCCRRFLPFVQNPTLAYCQTLKLGSCCWAIPKSTQMPTKSAPATSETEVEVTRCSPRWIPGAQLLPCLHSNVAKNSVRHWPRALSPVSLLNRVAFVPAGPQVRTDVTERVNVIGKAHPDSV
jgi:hypothetical protein